MRERSESRPEDGSPEENHDGRTMILLAASTAVICGLFVAAGLFVFGLIFDAPAPGAIALNAVESEPALVDQSVAEPGAIPAVATPPVLEPAPPAATPVREETPADIPDSTPVEAKPVAIEVAAVTPKPTTATPPVKNEPTATAPSTPTTLVAEAKPEPQPPVDSPGRQPAPETKPESPTEVTSAIPDSIPTERAIAEEAGPQPKSSTSGTPLTYQWNPGDIQGYSVSMATTANGQKQSVSGTVELTVDEQPPKVDSTAVKKKTKPETGTGTGFFVSADGYLVTCAHVIQGADKIDVQIDGKTHSANVVAVEPDDDLALLKIDAAGLATLSLADSSKVRLGEEVQAIGYPLSTVLGNGIKVTRGIVAGIVDRETGKRFQIDAAVNPGNSGGPVVNDRGQVLGVASSKLIGMALTRVGFCVPAERVLSLLNANKVAAADGGADKALSGPALVEAVAPSVALITVTIGPQAVSGELVRIRTSGKFRTKRETNNRQRPMFAFPNTTFNSGSLNVDAYGNVESFQAPNQLPFLAGPMALLTVHQFDPSGRSSWTVRERIKVTVQKDNSPLGRVRIPVPRVPRFGGRVRNPFAPETIKEFEAQVVHQYRIVSDSDDEVVLEKTFALTTLDNDESPYFRITGNGEVVFSRKLGLVESFEFDHQYEKNDGKETVRIPVEIIVVREDSAIVAERKRASAISQAKLEHDNAIKAASKAVVPKGEQVDALLKKIKEEHAKDGFMASQLGTLAKFAVLPERQSEVEAQLVDLLESKQYLTVRGALDALATWGTPNCVPAVIAQLKHPMFPVVQSAVKTLGTLRDEQAIAPLLETLQKNRLARHDAKGALIKFGTTVEGSAIALLFEKDVQVFNAACEILKEVGGEDSVEALEPISSGEDFSRKGFATLSLNSVKARIAAAKTAAASGDAAASDPSAPRVEAVLKAMTEPPDKSGFTRTKALMALGTPTDYKRVELEDALLTTLDDPNFAVQHQGMMALQKRATERSIPRLLKLFANPTSKLQFMAAQTLQKIGLGADGEQHLVAELPKADPKLQKAIVDLLTGVGSPESLEALDELANAQKASSIQFGAARAAARIRLRAGMPISS
ncbi:MAG: serine protease Do [Porticoccaceae bacterium]|jgi:serine protease Do